MNAKTDTTDTLAPIPLFDPVSVRADFPILSTKIGKHPLTYLDNAASTQKPKAVIDELVRFYTTDYANIHRGVHTLSQRATEAYDHARETVARYLGVSDAKEVVFVRGATEGINLVASTFGRAMVGKGDNLVLTAMEHHANIVPWQLLAEERGAEIRVLPVDDRGVLELEALPRLLDERTRLVSVAHVSNALGTVNPVSSIIATAHAQGVPVLVDAAQSVQHIPLRVADLDCDFLVVSGHKCYGPTGIGVLYGKSRYLREMKPYQGGGDMIEHVRWEGTTFRDPPERFEAGTPHIAGAIGLAAAFDYLTEIGLDRIARYEKDLLQYATETLQEVEGFRILGTAPEKASVISFLLGEIHPHDIGTFLDAEGIAVRTGHHCAEPLMRRFGISGTTRLSLSFYNTREEIDRLAQALRKIVRFFGS